MKFNSDFEKDIHQGLTDYPKSLPSKYIYDEQGDRLFQDIMQLPEYYLTRSEREVFDLHKVQIGDYLERGHEWDIVELGAGDGSKTRVLLESFLQQKIKVTYRPIDISLHALELVTARMNQLLPDLPVIPLNGTYFETLDEIGRMKERKKLILFLGSNIGNLLHPQAVDFLTRLQQNLNTGDLLLVGFDLKKDPAIIHSAYSDPQGVTEAFNKNLLARINRELQANFDLEAFSHWETYDPESGTCRSYLLSRKGQTVHIAALGIDIHFDEWESIHTEISQKYDDGVVQWLTGKAGLRIMDCFKDGKGWYADYLLSK